MKLSFNQLSTRQELITNAYIMEPDDFNWVKAELERIEARLPLSKKEEYYKKGYQDIYYWEPAWNKNIDV